MRKILFLFALSLSFLLVNAADQCLIEAKKNYKSLDYVRKNPLTVAGGYVFTAGIVDNAFSNAHGRDTASLLASANLLYLKELEIDTRSFDSRLKNVYRRKLFQQYQSIVNIKFTTRNLIKISEFSQGRTFVCVYACKLDNVKFSPDNKLSLKLVYNKLKQNPLKRNELIFFEIIPEKDIPALRAEIKANISRQYGEVFSCMFMDEKIKPLDREKYDRNKKQIAAFNGKTPFPVLISKINSVPYDPVLCRMLAKHFDILEMPRCAEIMRKCAEKNYKLEFIEPTDKKSKINSVNHSKQKMIDKTLEKQIKNNDTTISGTEHSTTVVKPENSAEITVITDFL